MEGDSEDAAIGMMSDNTAKLTSAVSSLPELLEKKRLIDMHTNIATGMLEHIKVSSDNHLICDAIALVRSCCNLVIYPMR